jgi:hypothetical protein
VRHRPCCVGDDEHVGLGLPRIQVGRFAHRQARQIRDFAAAVPGHRDRQRPDGIGLVDHHQDFAVFLKAGEQLPQPCLVLRQRLIENPLPGDSERRRMMLALANIQAAEDLEFLIHIGAPTHPHFPGRNVIQPI